MNLWLTADYHLGETRLEIMQRPFSTPEEMFDYIRFHQRIVQPDDHVIVVGDAVSKSADDPLMWLEWIKKLNGTKTLIRGNHDTQFSDEQLLKVFNRVIPDGGGIEMDAPDGHGGVIPCYITHYPTQSRPDRFNIVGHIHDRWKVQLNMYNCGVDVNHFRPVPIEKIAFFKAAIETFYDEDVWVADHPANAPYKGIRGKKGKYFNG